MENIVIKNRWNNEVILSGKYESIRDCLQKNRGADLSDANLSDADLGGADLSDANLSDADLSGADLGGADLGGADLRGAYLSGADLGGADLRGADLGGADLRGADLGGANLRGAYLSGADLSGADLRDANLRVADLGGADLRDANLSDAAMDAPIFLPDIYCLKQQRPGTILKMWKYLENGSSPYQHFEYSVGRKYEFDDADPDEQVCCSRGGNVATLQWCLKDSNKADEFMEVEFQVKNIVAIPYATDGKFRVNAFETKRIINREEAVALLKRLMNDE